MVAHSGTLESLELKFLPGIPCDDFGTVQLAKLINPKGSNKFSSLRKLCLANVTRYPGYIEEDIDELVGKQDLLVGFPVEQLESLRLLNCSNMLHFLQHKVDAGGIEKLKAFEFSRPELILTGDEDEATEAISWQGLEGEQLMGIVGAMEDLEELYLAFSDPAAGVTDFQTLVILTHSETLKRLVFHNYQDRCISQYDIQVWSSWMGAMLHNFHHTKIECVGLCLIPQELVSTNPTEQSSINSWTAYSRRVPIRP